MKVSVLVNEMNIRGGTHKQVVRLCEYLRRKNIEFEWITRCYELQKTYPECAGFNIKDINEVMTYNCDANFLEKIRIKLKDIYNQYRLYKMISKDTDVVNVHDNGLSFVICLCILNKRKVVWQINDLPGRFQVGPSVKSKVRFRSLNWLAKKYLGFLGRHVDLITVNVTKNRDRVKKCMAAEAKVFYCGTDLEQQAAIHKKVRDKKCIRIVSTGVFFPYRNYETQVKVVKELKRRGNDCHLDIIGSTELNAGYAAKIRDLIRENQLDDSITIHGQVDEKKFNEIYEDADAFLFINLDQSWGLAVFEAMGRGLPVIVSNSVGATELLNDGVDSLIVNPLDENEISDNIERLKDDSYYGKISKNAIRNVSHYTWDELYSSKMVKEFYRIIGEKR